MWLRLLLIYAQTILGDGSIDDMDTGKVNFWVAILAIIGVGLIVPGWLGANWVSLLGGAVPVAILVGMHIAKHGRTFKWRDEDSPWFRRDRRGAA